MSPRKKAVKKAAAVTRKKPADTPLLLVEKPRVKAPPGLKIDPVTLIVRKADRGAMELLHWLVLLMLVGAFVYLVWGR